MQVGTNRASLEVWKHYTSNWDHLRQSMFRLAGDFRLNHAEDNPLGLTMSERLRMRKRNTAAAEGNVTNRSDCLTFTGSWAEKVQFYLGRMSELVSIALNQDASPVELDRIQSEFQQLQDGILKIVDEDAYYNGNPLFGAANVVIQVGAGLGQEFIGAAFNLTAENTYDLGGKGWHELICSSLPETVSIRSYEDALTAVATISSAMNFVWETREEIWGEKRRMIRTLQSLQTYEENISAVESRIRDVDVAKETAEISKVTILKQVGSALRAHAHLKSNGELEFVV